MLQIRVDFRVGPDGAGANFHVDTQKGVDPAFKDALQGLADTLAMLVLPYPSKPVGVGAYWMVTSRDTLIGLDVVTYRLVKVEKGATNTKCKVVCDALILDDKSRSDTYPYIEIAEQDVSIGHEASVSRIGANSRSLKNRYCSEQFSKTVICEVNEYSRFRLMSFTTSNLIVPRGTLRQLGSSWNSLSKYLDGDLPRPLPLRSCAASTSRFCARENAV